MEGLAKEDFLEDKRTQQAVIMSLIVIGEAVTKIMDGYAEFTQAHAQVPWRNMRGMRNRITHGYFDINLDVVWDTVQAALPKLLTQLPAMLSAHPVTLRRLVQHYGNIVTAGRLAVNDRKRYI